MSLIVKYQASLEEDVPHCKVSGALRGDVPHCKVSGVIEEDVSHCKVSGGLEEDVPHCKVSGGLEEDVSHCKVSGGLEVDVPHSTGSWRTMPFIVKYQGARGGDVSHCKVSGDPGAGCLSLLQQLPRQRRLPAPGVVDNKLDTEIHDKGLPSQPAKRMTLISQGNSSEAKRGRQKMSFW